MYCADCPYCGESFVGIEYEGVRQQLVNHIYDYHLQQFLKDHRNLVRKAPKNIYHPEKWAIGYVIAFSIREC